MQAVTRVVMLTAGLAVAAAAVIFGQNPPPQQASAVRLAVDRVPVDVSVRGDDGRPVTGLTAADFTLDVDGRSRRIVSAAFVPSTRGAVPPAADQTTFSSNASGDERYLLIFEPESGDRDGKPHSITVAVPARTGLDIRARNQFSIEAPTSQTDEAILKETLQAPALASEIGLKLAAYTLRDPASDKLRILMAAEIERSGSPDGRLALAYSLVDEKGRLIHSEIDHEVKTPVSADAMQRYSGFILSDATGTHTLKIAVVDERGRRGSVAHAFRAGLTEVGEVRATDLLLADNKTGSGSADPAVGREFTSGTVNNYIELYAEAPEVLKNTTVMFEVAKDAQARALDGAAGRVQPASADSPNRRTLEGSIPLALLPPGDYVARAVVTTDGRKVGQVTRPFRVGRTATVVKPKPGPGPRTLSNRSTDIHLASRTERFERASVLTPEVISFFVERLNIGGRGEPHPEPVIEHARAGRFDDAVQALSTPGTSVPAAFLSGLALYSKGELEPAAARFREALRLDSEFFAGCLLPRHVLRRRRPRSGSCRRVATGARDGERRTVHLHAPRRRAAPPARGRSGARDPQRRRGTVARERRGPGADRRRHGDGGQARRRTGQARVIPGQASRRPRAAIGRSADAVPSAGRRKADPIDERGSGALHPMGHRLCRRQWPAAGPRRAMAEDDV